MKKHAVKILGKNYDVGPLNYAVMRKLGRLWNINEVDKVEQKVVSALTSIASAAEDDGKSLDFGSIDTLGEIILTVLEVNNDEVYIDDIDKLMNYLMYESPDTIEKIISQFAEDMQSPVPPKELQSKAKKKQPNASRKK